jgi:DNA (cytosine-5)-methyltransferase 1
MPISMRKAKQNTATAADSAPTFIDAFAGCGGLSLGLMRAGWRGQFAIEKDRFAFNTLKHNLLGSNAGNAYSWPKWLKQKPWCIDELLQHHMPELLSLRGKIDLLAGGPPCQGFSSVGLRNATDPRNRLVESYFELVKILQPRLVLMENVPGISHGFKKHGRRLADPSKNFAETLKLNLSREYCVHSATLIASSFGIPQRRPRFFLIAIRKSEPLASQAATFFKQVLKERAAFLSSRKISRRVTTKNAISDLEVSRTGTVKCRDSVGYEAISYRGPKTAFQRAMRDGFEDAPSDTRLAKHRPDIKRRFKRIITLCKADGHLGIKLSPKMRKKFGLKKYSTTVLDPNKPAPTITSMPDDLLHYNEPRTLTVRENARLQTFPDWFAFKGKYTTGGDRRRHEVPRFTQVANAVPPLLAELLGITMKSLVVLGEQAEPQRQKAA